MADERKKQGWAATALFAIAFVVFYAASSGPVVFALVLTGSWDRCQLPFGLFYCPFVLLPHPAIDVFDSWIDWWIALAQRLVD